MTCFRMLSTDERPLKIAFRGESSIDVGGPFRDAITNIVSELESPVLPLLIKTPNNKNLIGESRDCFMLNPDATSPA